MDKEETVDPKSDIRNAFFKASANAKPKSDTKSSTANNANDDDDLANEIMLELQKKKTVKSSVTNKPKPPPPSKPAFSQIPFSLNTNISKSPAHKRKLSPSANYNSENKLQSSETSRCNKKIELDDDLVQQLFDSDSQPAYEITQTVGASAASNKQSRLNDVSNSNFIKSEPIEMDSTTIMSATVTTKSHLTTNVVIKKETDDDLEALENIELLSQLSLVEAKQLNSQFKQEANGVSTSSDLDIDFQLHMKNQSSSNKFLFYWLDAFEDQFNSNGTIYLFGKMPILKQNSSFNGDKKDATSVSFVSVCCVVKNIPKIVYVLPRKYKKPKIDVKVEPGVDEKETVTMEKVCKEIESLLEKNKIHSYKTKVVKKNFAFDIRGKNLKKVNILLSRRH